MTLNSVVLPAPFGPIRAAMEPSATPKVAPSTARMPPKRLTTPSISSKGLPLGVAVSVAKDHLLALAEHALRPVGHQSDQQQPRYRQAQRGDPGLGERRVGGGGETAAFDHGAEEDCPHRPPPVVC